MLLAKTSAHRNAVRMQLTWKSLAYIHHSPCSVLVSAIKRSWSIKHIGLHISMSVFGGFGCLERSLFMSYGNSSLSWTWWTLNTGVARCLWITQPTKTEWVLGFKCWMFSSKSEEAVFHQKKWREVLFHQCCRYWGGRITMSRLVSYPAFSFFCRSLNKCNCTVTCILFIYEIFACAAVTGRCFWLSDEWFNGINDWLSRVMSSLQQYTLNRLINWLFILSLVKRVAFDNWLIGEIISRLIDF